MFNLHAPLMQKYNIPRKNLKEIMTCTMMANDASYKPQKVHR